MRIGVYDPYLDDLGGGEKYMMTLVSCLLEKHRVDIFWDKKKDIDAIADRFEIDLSSAYQVSNIFSPRISFFKRLLSSRKYDVIIVLSDGSIPFLLSKKTLIHIQQPLYLEKKTYLRAIKLKRIARFFCNSEFTKTFLEKELQAKSKVIYPPVALYPLKIEKQNIILHVGRFRVNNVGISDYKKQQVMVSVFKELVDQGLQNWKFVVASGVKEKDQKEFDELKKSAEGYPVEFIVNCKNNILWSYYSQAKIYWHASGFGEDLVAHPEYAEHFGISTVEAMGCSCVPVVINAGGQKEIVTDGINGFLWNSLDEFKKKTVQLIKYPEVLNKLSYNAKNRAKDFSYIQFCTRVNELLNE